MLFSKDSHGYVYKWTELSTGKWYIGSRSAKNCHINDGYICSSKIVKPLITSNPKNWIREILWIGDRELAPTVESLFLSENNAANNNESYNLHNSDGKWNTAGVTPHNKGKSHKPESIQKMRENRSNPSEYTRKLISDNNKGRSAPNKGVEHSEETKEKIRIKAIGRTHTDKTKLLISEIVSGRVLSEITKQKMSMAQKGKKKSKEHIEKIADFNRNKALIKHECEHCGKRIDLHNFKRWHGDNCKVINPTVKRNQCNVGRIVSSETKEKLSLKAKNRKKIKCEYCDKIINQSAYTRFHGDNCKHKYTNHQEK